MTLIVRRQKQVGLDSTIALLRDPYRFISRECRTRGTDLFRTRFLLQPAIFMTGPALAEVFYSDSRIIRKGAAPEPLMKTLLGTGGIQGLDAEAHCRRKQMFLTIITPDSVERLATEVRKEWRREVESWKRGQEHQLYSVLHSVLTRAVCRWAGIPLSEREVSRRTDELTALFDAAGSVGPRHLWSRMARWLAESWLRMWIRRIRDMTPAVPSTPAEVVATHRNVGGDLLPEGIAAVELLNLLRPVVAVSVYMTFAAHALVREPGWLDRLQEQPRVWKTPFGMEVRRFYPFFPAAVAKVGESFEAQGYRFDRGTRVLMDLYGTNHDERAWDEPQRFDPNRFLGRNVTPFEFIPQGGGNAEVTHRCPGEPITMALIQAMVEFLATDQLEFPPQDLEIDFGRLPALPRSRIVLRLR